MNDQDRWGISSLSKYLPYVKESHLLASPPVKLMFCGLSPFLQNKGDLLIKLQLKWLQLSHHAERKERIRTPRMQTGSIFRGKRPKG
jgi:hypothetical protein